MLFKNRAKLPLFSPPRRGRCKRGIVRPLLFGCGSAPAGVKKVLCVCRDLVECRRRLAHLFCGRQQADAQAHRAMRKRTEVFVRVGGTVKTGTDGDIELLIENRGRFGRRPKGTKLSLNL